MNILSKGLNNIEKLLKITEQSEMLYMLSQNPFESLILLAVTIALLICS